jgi:hypothetical protein
MSFINEDLAPFYGLELSGARFVQVELPAERAGLFTQLHFLNRGTVVGSSPPVRGFFARDALFCQDVGTICDLPLVPRPDDVSTRQYYEDIYQRQGCDGCHDYMTMGFAFESFDGLGRTRSEDNGIPVQTSTEVLVAEDETLAFADAPAMLGGLEPLDSVRDCFARKWLAFLLGRPPRGAWDLFRRYCEEPASGAGSLPPLCEPGTSESDTLVERASCAWKSGELYLGDLVAVLASSRLAVDEVFECGPALCLREKEYCRSYSLTLDGAPVREYVCEHYTGQCDPGATSASCCSVDEAGNVFLACP